METLSDGLLTIQVAVAERTAYLGYFRLARIASILIMFEEVKSCLIWVLFEGNQKICVIPLHLLSLDGERKGEKSIFLPFSRPKPWKMYLFSRVFRVRLLTGGSFP